jgi:hypothetical protein
MNNPKENIVKLSLELTLARIGAIIGIVSIALLPAITNESICAVPGLVLFFTAAFCDSNLSKRFRKQLTSAPSGPK